MFVNIPGETVPGFSSSCGTIVMYKLFGRALFLGGLRALEAGAGDPSCDLAVLAALLSSAMGLSVPRGTCFLGEVGLTGEFRRCECAHIVCFLIRVYYMVSA